MVLLFDTGFDDMVIGDGISPHDQVILYGKFRKNLPAFRNLGDPHFDHIVGLYLRNVFSVEGNGAGADRQ